VSPESDGWVPRFHQQLPPGTALLNLGVSSSLLSQALEQQLPVAVAAKPDVVTVWLAVNDLNARVPLEAYSRDLDRLLEALDPGHTLVLVANVPDLTAAPAYRAVDPNRLHLAVGQWNAAIGNVVQQRGAVLVDLSNTWQELGRDPGLISPDGFHPSSDGYARVSERFVAAFEANRAKLAVSGV
jgi:lysophospholipase L1-like esterase